MLACLLAYLLSYTCLYRGPNCPVTTVNFNRPKSHTRCPLDFHRLHLVYFKFEIYLPELGRSPLSSAFALVGGGHPVLQWAGYPLPKKQASVILRLGDGGGKGMSKRCWRSHFRHEVCTKPTINQITYTPASIWRRGFLHDRVLWENIFQY